MTAQVAVPSRLAKVGIGLEVAYGAGAAPTMLLPVTAPAPTDGVGLLPDQSWRGSAGDSYGHVVGPSESALQLGGLVYPDSIGYLLAGVLGDVALTAGSPNSWAMALLNSGAQQPPSYAVTVSDPVGGLQYAGCKVASLNLVFDAAAAFTWSATLQGLAGVVSAAAVPAASAESMMQSWIGSLLVGGVTEAKLLSGQISFARTVTAKRNVNGQQAPWLQRTDVLAVSGKLTVILASDTYRQNMLNGVVTSLLATFAHGTGSGLRSLAVQCSSVMLSGASRAYGSKWIEADLSFVTDSNTTDVGASGGLSPVKATLKNTVGAGVYA